MKITTRHMGACARHIADVLGDTDTSRAEVLTLALLGDAPVYADLGAVDVGVVSEGLKDAGVAVPAIKRGTLAALFARVRPGAATCAICGRLALRLEGSTWSAWTAPTCPVDSGLYAADVVPVVRGWHDGREYPEGTTHDPHGVPLDSSTIRAERTVAAEVDAEIRVRRHRPTVRVWSPEIARAALRVRWQIDLARATVLYARLRRIDETAAAMHSRRERVSALQEAAGVRTPRRRCSAAPRGGR